MSKKKSIYTLTGSSLKNIAIYGAGGFGKETKFLLDSINRNDPQFVFQGFIDDDPGKHVERADLEAAGQIAIAIAWPSVRRGVHQKCGRRYAYPDLVDPGVIVDPSVSMGQGCIICAGVRITVDVAIGDFVIINLNATIGHDVRIGSYSSIMPSVNISGNVHIEEGVFIGSGATVLQGLRIGKDAVIGAGAVVTRDVPAGVVAKGVPARWSV